jgi:hypothetical protein
MIIELDFILFSQYYNNEQVHYTSAKTHFFIRRDGGGRANTRMDHALVGNYC